MWGGGRPAPGSVTYVPKHAPSRAYNPPPAAAPVHQAIAVANPVPPAATAAAPVAPASSIVLYTVGYGGMDGSAAFVDLLRKNEIAHLWDIRVSPYSGNKQFNTKELSGTLLRAGINYMHGLEMGNVWKGADNDDDAHGRLTLYEELVHLAGELLTRRLRDLLASNNGRVAIMCACGKWTECHRAVVSTFLEKNYGYQIVHINNLQRRCVP